MQLILIIVEQDFNVNDLYYYTQRTNKELNVFVKFSAGFERKQLIIELVGSVGQSNNRACF